MNKTIAYWLIFALNPFFSLMLAIRSYRESVFKNILWMFCAFYGYTFVLYPPTSDANAHVSEFIELAKDDALDFDRYGSRFFATTGKGGEIDLVIPLIKFSLSRVTDDPQVLLAIIGLIFGFFYSRNVWILIKVVDKPLLKLAATALVLYCFLWPPWSVNAFRFPVATHIFLFGILNVFILKKRWGWIFIFLSTFVHFSLAFGIGMLFVQLLIGNKIKLYMLLLLLALLPNVKLQTSAVKDLLPKTEINALEGRKNSYLDESYIELNQTKAARKNWYVNSRYEAIKYLIAFLALVLYRRRKDLKEYPQLYNVFNFSVFLMAMSILLNAAAASLGRFTTISQMLVLAVFIIYASIKSWELTPTMSKIFTLIIIFFIVVEIRIGFYTVSLDTIFSNPLISYFFGQSSIHLDWLLKPIR